MDFRPGAYVLYAPENRPPWPAVICADEMIPRALFTARPSPYLIGVLLLQKNQIRWAHTAHIKGIGQHVCPEDLAKKHPSLREAYDCLVNSIADNHSPAFWKIVISNSYETHETGENMTQQIETDSDPDLERGIQESSKVQSAGKRQADPEAEADLDTEEPTASPPKRRRIASLQSRGQLPTGTFRQIPISPPSSKDSQSAGITHSSNEVREDKTLIDDKQIAAWEIGPKRQPFYIPISAVLKRDHLKEMKILHPTGSEGWRVHKPSFANINVEKFPLVAQFLASDDFHFQVSTENLNDEEIKSFAIEGYCGAWEVAEILSLHDMMEQIVEKMKELKPWPLLEMIVFADTVYSVPALEEYPVAADLEMRHLISAFLATCYRNHGSEFHDYLQEKMQKFPELARDVYQSLADEAAEPSQRNQETPEEEEL